ncbi:MAG: alanine--tRNA ligase [Syntrophales bacterium]|nr:alanine--tRNA ligase [Syntrophales bacterium]
MMRAGEIRESFLIYFEGKDHARVLSSSLIPKDDPSLLFTNAGMVQFKNCFLGREERPYKRAVTAQKCARAGGKHNDLENVGITSRHHTFFEMLGNFSFGDYGKEEAITWGWEYLTSVVGLPKERLWVTIYRDDEEAFAVWRKKIGLPTERIVRMGEKSNFWMMGETGPCGPCSEIIYDQGEGTGCGKSTCDINCDCDRHLELWNLVFTQFDRDDSGRMTPLPKPSIDTGMGLERLAAVIRGVTNNYDTDLFCDIIRFIEEISGKTYRENERNDISIRVIADHSRAVTFLVGDGVLPSNEGRGYVLRRILRRAARHGKLLGLEKPFLHRIAVVVIDVMKDAYPDLAEKTSFIRKVVENEEERFTATLDAGLNILQEEVASLRRAGENCIPGDVVFKLYDTYGFPTDLTVDIVRDDGLAVDMEGFHKAMETQREKARAAWKGSGEEAVAEHYQRLSSGGISSAFTGYGGVIEDRSRIVAILKKGQLAETATEGEDVEIIVENTPFYGESGGQEGDTGFMEDGDFRFEVLATLRPLDNLITHSGKVKKGEGKVGDTVRLVVDETRRKAEEANHSGTHILQAALKAILGDHIKQAGSLVSPERLRFDFTHFSRVGDDELERIETLANQYIRENLPLNTEVLSLEESLKTGATAVFGERYGEEVRIVRIGDVSMELCGGTHVARTGDIGLLKIIHESSVAAGVRRIEALTGGEAVRYVRTMEKELKEAANLLKTNPFELAERTEKLLRYQRDLGKEIETLKAKLTTRDSSDLLSNLREIKGVPVLAALVEAADAKTLRDFGDKLRDRLPSGIILLGSETDGKAMLLCIVTKDLTARYHAGRIIKELAPLVGGSGGGRPDMAQAGGSAPENLGQALAKLQEML